MVGIGGISCHLVYILDDYLLCILFYCFNDVCVFKQNRYIKVVCLCKDVVSFLETNDLENPYDFGIWKAARIEKQGTTVHSLWNRLWSRACVYYVLGDKEHEPEGGQCQYSCMLGMELWFDEVESLSPFLEFFLRLLCSLRQGSGCFDVFRQRSLQAEKMSSVWR